MDSYPRGWNYNTVQSRYCSTLHQRDRRTNQQRYSPLPTFFGTFSYWRLLLLRLLVSRISCKTLDFYKCDSRTNFNISPAKRTLKAKPNGEAGATEKTLLQLVTVSSSVSTLTVYHCVQAGVVEKVEFENKETCTGQYIDTCLSD